MPKVKPIFISLSPNAFARDVWLAVRLFFTPWKWKRGKAIADLEQELQSYLPVRHAVSFDSGRSSWYAILKALDVGEGDEVLVQAFTCVVVPNPIIWCGAKPVYVDVERATFNMDLDDLERKITPRSKVLLIQHTFGLPQDMEHLMEIARKHNLIVVEDCAHSLGASVRQCVPPSPRLRRASSASDENWRKVGTFGQAAFFSFGRDKVISGVHGGMAVTDDPELAARLREFQNGLDHPSTGWILQHLIHPILFALIKKLYFTFSIGKVLLVVFQKMGLLSKAVVGQEKQGSQPKVNPSKMPNALAQLALEQFGKSGQKQRAERREQNFLRMSESGAELPSSGWRLDEFNAHRRQTAKKYEELLADLPFVLPKEPEGFRHIFMRYSILLPQRTGASKLLFDARKENMLLGDWYKPVVAPGCVNYEKISFAAGSCPVAVELSDRVVNLPTYPAITSEDVERVVEFLKHFFDAEGR